MMIFVVNRDACTGCEECLGICPTGALQLKAGKAHINMAHCLSCGACLRECGEAAISMVSIRTGEAASTQAVKEDL